VTDVSELYTLMLRIESASEVLINIYQTIRRRIPEDIYLHNWSVNLRTQFLPLSRLIMPHIGFHG
jgi:hypothetical protein